MQKHRQTQIVSILLVGTVICLALAWMLPSAMASSAMPTARTQVKQAWNTAANSGRYGYRSTVTQTTHPTLRLENVGRTTRTEQFVLEGEIDNQAERMLFELTAANQTPVQVKIERGKGFGRISETDPWTEIEVATDLFAPGGDPLGFLVAMENVRIAEGAAADDFFPTGLLPASTREAITRYQFDLDGLKYAQFMRAEMEEYLRSRGELPGGLTLQMAQAYVDMLGTGELWVSHGTSGRELPVRQILRLQFPAEDGASEWTDVEIITDFSGWAEPQVPQWTLDWQQPGATALSLLDSAGVTPHQAQDIGYSIGALLFLCALAGTSYRLRQYQWVRGTVYITVILSMVIVPLLQATQTAAAVDLFTARRKRMASTTNLAAPKSGDVQATSADVASLSTGDALAVAPSLQTFALAQQSLAISANCVITATSDCDGDGLTDNIEIYELGTRIDRIDSDDDGISDKTEVTSFSVGGQEWYLDPLRADTNGDGLTDGAECLGRTDVVDGALDEPLFDSCDDTDTDGIPNVHDFDDDGDGVPDEADLSHLESQTVANQTFNLEISGANPDKNLMVDFQVRPVDDRHLWWTNSVLNWPDGDTGGQIRRVTTDTLATDGDMQMIPMLEIAIPYSSDNPSGGLPISGTQTITQGTPIESWLDTELMDQYQINFVTTMQGDKVGYVPLIPATDPNGGSPVAWQARMPYRLASGVTDWGAAHQVKVAWLVSGQVDSCEINCDDPANWQSSTQILQIYYDDFIVTGMQVQEHHGAEAMMVAQNSHAGPYEPELWHLADTLQHVYLASQTVNDQRFTLGDIPTTYTSWGIGGLTFDHITGLAEDVALLNAMNGEAAAAFLANSMGSGLADGAVANVMLLSEETRRTRLMGEVEDVGTGDDVDLVERFVFDDNTFSVDLASALLKTTGVMRLQPYAYTNGLGWDSLDIVSFLTDLQSTLEDIFTPAEMAALLAGDSTSDSARAKDGAILLAMNYYLSLYISSAMRLEISGELLNGEPLVNSEHQRPDEPVTAIVQRLATNLKTYFGLLSLNQLDIPSVESDKTTGAAASWANLAASRGEILAGFGDVLQGDSASSATLALLEIANYADTVDTTALLDLGVYFIVNTVLTDYLANGTSSIASGQASDNQNGDQDGTACSVFVCGISVAVYAANRARVMLTVERKIISKVADYDIIKYAAKWRKELADVLKNDPTNTKDIEVYRNKLAVADAETHKLVGNRIKFFTMAGVAAVVVQSGLTIAIALATGQVQADAPAFSRLVAEQIGRLIVETFYAIVYLVALSTATFALSVVLTVIGIIDAVMIAVCSIAKFDDGKSYARWLCGGISGAIAQALAYVINDTTPIVDLARDDMRNVVLETPALGNETGLDGVIVGNSVTLSGSVTTTLYMDDPNWMGYFYWWQWDDENLERSTFAYKLQGSPRDVPLDLDGVDWTPVPGRKKSGISANDARFYAQLPIAPYVHTFSQPGIDLGLPVYLAEGYAVRKQNCWLTVVGALISCWVDKFDDTGHISFEDRFLFDVLPGTLDEFRALALSQDVSGKDGYRLAWDTQFPRLADADGDSLRSQATGGVDPNDSSADSDADGLPDYFEISQTGFDAQQADGDCDGLTDYWELFYRTNPALADSDGDGLTDGEEHFHPNRIYPYENSTRTNLNPPACAKSTAIYAGGWPIVYDFDDNGNALTTWVNADPLDPDSDDDALTDKQERIYAYNPNVASGLNVLGLDTQIETSSGTLPYVAPTGSISYTAVVTNELTLPYARGLLETELPLDQVYHRRQMGVIAPQTAVNLNGSIEVAQTGLTSSQTVDMGIRAGAIIDDPTGRVLWLHMNEPSGSTTFVDDSFRNHDGTCSTCPTANGRNATFANSTITVPADPEFSLSNFSVGFDMVRSTDTGSGTLFVMNDFSIALENDTIAVRTRTGHAAVASQAVPADEWVHIMATVADGTSVRLYVDGVLRDEPATGNAGSVVNADLTIGWPSGSGSIVLDEVEVLTTVLNAATIRRRYGKPVLQIDLRDDSTWADDGVSCTGAACPTVTDDGATFAQKQHLSIPAPDLSNDEFSFVTWIKPVARTAPMNALVASHYGRDTDKDWQGVFGNLTYVSDQSNWPFAEQVYPSLFVSSDGELRMIMANGPSVCQVTSEANSVEYDAWQQLAISYDGSAFTFYVNGEPIGSGPSSNDCAAITPPDLSTLYLGRPNPYGFAWLDRLYVDSAAVPHDDSLPIDPDLNLNSDDVGGNIWEAQNVGDNSTVDIKKVIFMTSDASSNWIRLYHDNRKPWDGYQSKDRFAGRAADINLKHLTKIENDSYLGLKGYQYEVEAGGGEASNTGTLYFGVFNDFFRGELDDFRVYNYGLSAEAALDIFTAASTALELRFDEAPGSTTFTDQSGNNVTVSCSATTCPGSGIPGRNNQALDFDGVDDFLTLSATGTDLGLGRESWTVAMWVKPDTFRGALNNGELAVVGTNNNRIIGMLSYGDLGVLPNGNFVSAAPHTLYNSKGRWYHLAYVFEPVPGSGQGTYRFYVNGELVGSEVGNRIAAGSEVYIGKTVYEDNHYDFFDGLIDDLRIIKKPLTQAQIRAIVDDAPTLNLHLDEDLASDAFQDDSQNDYDATCEADACPEAGDKGQMREAVTFGGSDLLTASNMDQKTLTNFSIGLWVKPTKKATDPQYLLNKEGQNSASFRLWLPGDTMTVRFARPDSCLGDSTWQEVDAAIPLLQNQWNHVMATHDAVNGVMAVYINGAPAGINSAIGTDICTGASPLNIGQGFHGGLDEVTIRERALSAKNVAAIYAYQSAWFDVINLHQLEIDADIPTVDLSKIPSTIGTAQEVFYIRAEDGFNTIPTNNVEYRIDGGAWQKAQGNNGTASSAAWLFYFQEAVGSHSIEARATDIVGNVSPLASASVQVDGQAPNLTVNAPIAPVRVVEQIAVDGTVSDDGGEVVANGLTVATLDHNGTPVTSNQNATVAQNGTWQATQPFPVPPYGVYTTIVHAADGVGNRAQASGALQLDGLPPYADLVESTAYINPAIAKTFMGIASDVPHPAASRTLHLHFENGAGVFVDGSESRFTMECTECPSTGIGGQYGEAISFDGVDDVLDFSATEVITSSTPSQQLGLADASFTVMAWVNASDWSGDHAILGSSPITTSNGFYLGIQDSRPILGYGGDDSILNHAIPTNQWVHLAWRFDATTGQRAFFINGSRPITGTVGHAAFDATEPVQIGRARGGNAYAGMLDELVIYAQPLADETIYDIANPLDVGISALQLRFRAYDERDIAQDAGTWYPVGLASTSSNFTTWSFDMPVLPIGAYKIDLMVTDAVGNHNYMAGVWDGALVRPDLALAKQGDKGLAAPNESIGYTLAYSNAGQVAAQNVLLSEVVPLDTTFNAAASHPAWTCQPDGSAGSNCALALGDVALAVGGAVTFTLNVSDPLSPGTSRFVNAASITSDGGDSNSEDNSSEVTVYTGAAPDLVLSIQDNQNNTIGAGEFVSYTVSYTNTGVQHANAILRLVVPAQTRFYGRNLQYVENAPAWLCAGDSTAEDACTFDLGVVAIGSSGIETFYLQVDGESDDGDQITMTVEITDPSINGADLEPSDNIATTTTNVTHIFNTGVDLDLVVIQEGQTVTNSGFLNVPYDGYEFATYPPPSIGTAEFVMVGTQPVGWTWQWDSSDGPDDTQEVIVYFSDTSSNLISTTFNISITNVAPTVAILGDETVAVGSSYSITLGSVVDPGTDTVTGCTLFWGDGASDDCFGALNGGTLNHVYGLSVLEPLIQVELTDEDGTHEASTKLVRLTNLPTYTLNVNVIGEGSVTDGGGLGHAATYELGTVVSLVASPAPGWELADWSGAAVGATSPISVTISGATNVSATFTKLPPVLYTLTSSVQGNGSVAPADGSYEAGIVVPITATAASGWQFVNWSGAAAGATNTNSITMNGDRTVTALFIELPPETYDLSLLVEGNGSVTNGAVTGSIGSSISQAYVEGTSVSVSATPAPGWAFDAWSGDLSGSSAGTNITIDGDRAATATFVAIDYSVTTNAIGSGSVIVRPAKASYTYGDVVNIIAVSAPGSGFDTWQGDLSSDAVGENLTIDGDKSVTAVFSERTYTVQTEILGSGSVSLQPDQAQYAYGEVVTVVAAPADGWAFSRWNLDLDGETITTTLTIDGDKTILALFEEATYVLNTSWIGDGTVRSLADRSEFEPGEVITITAAPNQGYVFGGWREEGNEAFFSTGLTTTTKMTEDKSILAQFDAVPYTVTVNIVGSGTATPTVGIYALGETAELTATPATYWSFVGWSGDVISASNAISFTVDATKEITATFIQVSAGPVTYSLSVNVVGRGTVTPTNGVYATGTVVRITATAGGGSSFTGWSGDLSGYLNPNSVTMDAHKVVTATFESTDLDADGVNDAIENGAPNDGDGNSDGIPDSQQPNVASLGNPIRGEYLSLVTREGTALANVGATDESPPNRPRGPIFRLGFLGFEVTGISVGDAVTVTLLTTDTQRLTTYFKYGPRPLQDRDHWYRFGYDGTTGAQFMEDRIVLYFVDGQRGDHDLTANGVIRDPGGPAQEITHTLTVEVVGSGVVTPSSSSYISGTVVSITSTAAAGWQFSGWDGDLTGLTSPLTVTMDADKAVTATFLHESDVMSVFLTITPTNPAPNKPFTLTATVSRSGSIDTDSDGMCTMDGLVRFHADAADLGSAFLGRACRATLELTDGLTSGSYAFRAVYEREDGLPPIWSITQTVHIGSVHAVEVVFVPLVATNSKPSELPSSEIADRPSWLYLPVVSD